MPTVPVFTPEALDQIKRVVRIVLRREVTEPGIATYRSRRTEARLFGFLADDLDAADDPRVGLTGLPTATLNIYKATSGGGLLITSPLETETVYNRQDHAFSADTYLECTRKFGKWFPDQANCGPTDLS